MKCKCELFILILKLVLTSKFLKFTYFKKIIWVCFSLFSLQFICSLLDFADFMPTMSVNILLCPLCILETEVRSWSLIRFLFISGEYKWWCVLPIASRQDAHDVCLSLCRLDVDHWVQVLSAWFIHSEVSPKGFSHCWCWDSILGQRHWCCLDPV